MSIYLAKSEMINFFKKNNMDYKLEIPTHEHVATLYREGEPNYLNFSDYSERDLKELVNDYEDVIVQEEFWNYNYCDYRNINPEVSDIFVERLKVIIDDYKDFTKGTLTVLILLHELLLNVYLIEKLDVFYCYLEKLKLSNKHIRNFLINMDYQLPLTKNYLALITKTFSSVDIFDFLFKECCQFDHNEFRSILENYKVTDLDEAANACFSINNTKTSLEYMLIIIDMYDDKIDKNDMVYYNYKNKQPYLGYILLSLKIPMKLEVLYYRVIKEYMGKYGSVNFQLSDNDPNYKLVECRKKEIKEYFDLF